MTQKSKYILGGILVASALFIAYSDKQRKSEPVVYVKEKLLGNYNARTIPPFGIYVSQSQKDNKRIIEHEMEHWKQFQQNGLLGFMFNYAKQNIENGYDGNELEIQARKDAGESVYCQNNYTKCVRYGLAKTVHNPDFRK